VDFCIEISMLLLERSFGISVLLLSLVIWAVATPGSFRGTIVDNPSAIKGWIYVQGRNGSARRVEISHAQVVYDEDVPASERRAHPEGDLTAGTEVRVTAEQGRDGEWHASRVEILKGGVAGERSSNQNTTVSD
jgi:hypothetical protein